MLQFDPSDSGHKLVSMTLSLNAEEGVYTHVREATDAGWRVESFQTVGPGSGDATNKFRLFVLLVKEAEPRLPDKPRRNRSQSPIGKRRQRT